MSTLNELKNLATQYGATLSYGRNDEGMDVPPTVIAMPPTREQSKNGDIGDVIKFTTIDETIAVMRKWAELCELKHDIKKKEISEFIREKLSTNDKWAQKALLTIMARQTPDEQVSEHTYYNNNVGFTGHDSPLMTSFAKQLATRKWLSKKQMDCLKKNIKKYWKQIMDASDELTLLRMVKASRNAQQTSLRLE